MKIVLLAWLREIIRAPLQSSLSIIGVTLGVTAVVAVQVANHSARESFLAASSVMEESATHSITGKVSDALYRDIRLGTNFLAQPVVSGRVRVVGPADQSATIYGIDPIANFQFDATSDTLFGSSQDANQLLSEAFSAFATDETLNLFDVKVGDRVKVRFGRKHYDLKLIGTLQTDSPLQQQSLRSLFLVDIATAQAIFEMRGRLSAIQLQLPNGEAASRAIEKRLPPGALLEGGLNRQRSIRSITEAFQTNLTAMSLLALLVAVFLIYNTMTFLVIRRKPTIRMLRAVGVSRLQITSCLALETMTIGTAAAGLGLLFGIELAKLLLSMVAQSINNLYFPIEADLTIVSISALILGLVLGIGATMLSAVPALREALRVRPSFGPRFRVSITARPGTRTVALVACGLFVLAGFATMQLWPTSIVFGFISIYCMVAAYFCLVPMLCQFLGRLMRAIAKRSFGIRGILASRALVMTGGRTSVAICALCVAISATVGVGVMINSFRTTVDDWLGGRLSADLYISTQGYGDELSESEVSQLRTLPGVDAVGVANWTWLQGPDGRSRVFAFNYGERAYSGYRFKSQVPEVWQRFETHGVIVSEPYAWKRQIKTGETIEFWQDDTRVLLPVLGVFYDYSSDRGMVAMHRNVYTEHFKDERVTTAAVFTKPETDLQSLENAADQIVQSWDVNYWQARALHKTSMEIFDQTFAITAILRTLAVIVAVVAVASTLTMIQIDRERELRIQSAIGFTSREIWTSATAEAGVMGLFAGLLSIPVGLMLTWLLIWVVNQRSFGWTMQMLIDGSILVEAIVFSVVAAMLAGLIPAWRLAKRAQISLLQVE